MNVDIKQLRAELGEQFLKLSGNRKLVETAVEALGDWLLDPMCEPLRDSILAHVQSGQYPLLLDSFLSAYSFRHRRQAGARRVRAQPYQPCDGSAVRAGFLQLPSDDPAGRRPGRGCLRHRIFSDLAGAYRFLGENHPLVGLTSRLLAIRACEIYAANGFEVCTPLIGRIGRRPICPRRSFRSRFGGSAHWAA